MVDGFADDLEAFWHLVLDVWQHGVLGVDIGQALVALLILLGFLAIRRLFTSVVVHRLKRWADRSDTRIDNALVGALENPVRFVPVVAGVFFALEYLALEGTPAQIGENFTRSLIAFTIFWVFFNLVDPLSYLLGRLETIFTPSMVAWLVKAIKGAFVFVGAATILEIWGIAVGPILAGLGLFGVAVALGAQDLFKNLIAGLLILAEKRFNPGDWILVDGVVEGTVENIGFRSTLVRRFDKAPIYVPNSKLSDDAVTNFSSMTHWRIYWKIGVEYRTTAEQLRAIRDGIEHYILENQEFAHPPEVPTFVRIDAFNDSSIDILVYCFTRTTIWGEWLRIKEELAYHIKEVVEGAGSGFAFPSRSLYVETMPEDTAEAFVPPEPGEPPAEVRSDKIAGGRRAE